ncbi:integral membrane protein, YjbE family [Paenibacillus sp. UNCCL117]|uniref:TerC family protein n=1 Tax=unclassified Paenibacillus TaxID=185978 RepID=UPI000890F2C6|nr:MULTISPECIES: TerC family protein [unclassified Paenibacillus]SDC73096.1 integral membrane protein, YjbE family [Paenibacillus sp. cl123]SFW24942.1 integral membrane protein, YjbE family [Paenibacillus sp. UNCCL117]
MLWENVVLFFEIMLINIVLSGDNAVVIALASKNLPAAQRKQAIWWGAFGAIGLRVVLTVVAVYVLDIPYIQGIGSLLLLWIAIKLLVDDEGHADVKVATTLGKAVGTIILADFVMSLDNVLAIAAKAQGEIGIIILGIGLSIPIIVWGSNLVVKLLKNFPVLVFLGAGILGYTAGEMFLADTNVSNRLLGDTPHFIIPLVTTVIVIASGVIKKLITPRHS